MALTTATNSIVDTNARTSKVVSALSGNTDEVASIIADVSTLKYALVTVTLAAAPTTNFCIGEIVSTNDSSPVHMVVQDYTAGASTFTAYRCTSGTDNTPLGWAAAANLNAVIAVGKTVTGSISGLSSQLTHGSTRVLHIAKTISLTKVFWNVQTFKAIRLFFDGSGTEQTIMYLGGSGNLNLSERGGAIGMGAAAGDTSAVLGDLTATTIGAAANASFIVGFEIQKGDGFAVNTANKRDKAVNACSPPDNPVIFFIFFPGGLA